MGVPLRIETQETENEQSDFDAVLAKPFTMEEIALSTDVFELDEIDISHLAVGDAETIVTASGKTVDLLRTEHGVEIYVDGELMDLPHMGAHGGHEGHHDGTHKVIMIESDSEIEDVDGLHEAHESKVIVIRKKVEESL